MIAEWLAKHTHTASSVVREGGVAITHIKTIAWYFTVQIA